MIRGEKLQQRRNHEPVWVTQVQWNDGSWGPYPAMGCGDRRNEAARLASDYIKAKKISWAVFGQQIVENVEPKNVQLVEKRLLCPDFM